jgi:hypothetical protein
MAAGIEVMGADWRDKGCLLRHLQHWDSQSKRLLHGNATDSMHCLALVKSRRASRLLRRAAIAAVGHWAAGVGVLLSNTRASVATSPCVTSNHVK